MKIKVKVKEGSKGKPLGQYIAKYRQEQGEGGGNKLYEPKVKLTMHLEKWRQQD
jgi:hypothetical protein